MKPRSRKPIAGAAPLPLMTESRPPEGWHPDEPPCLDGVQTLRMDFETDGVAWWKGRANPCGVSLYWDGGHRYLPFAHKGGGNLDEKVVKRWAERELRHKRIVNLNTKFEMHVSRLWGVDLVEQGNTFGDVAHYAALIDDRRRTFSLEAIATDTLPDDPQYRKVPLPVSPDRIHELPAWLAQPYALRDTFLVDAIAKVQGPLLGKLNLVEVRKLEDSVLPAVAEMEWNGILLDVPKLERWVNESGIELEKTLWRVYRLTGLNLEPDKDASCRAVFAKLNLAPGVHPDDGGESFAAAAIRPLLRGQDLRYEDPDGRVTLTDLQREVLTLMLRAKQLTSIRSKYLVKYWNGRTGDKLRYTLHQLRGDENGTISGRFSSSMIDKKANEGANIQQVMSVGKQMKALGEKYIIRELFVAPPGRRRYAADAKQIEYRVFADMAKVPRLLKAYADNPEIDYHDMTQAILAEQIREGLDRKQTKNTNFAKIFGAGEGKIARMNEMSLEKTRRFLEAYDAAFPEVAGVIEDFKTRAERDGVVTTKLGRRTTFAKRRDVRGLDEDAARRLGDTRWHKALNAAVQGTAADIMKRKLAELHAERKALDLVMEITVHDEFGGHVDAGDDGARINELLNRQTTATDVPIFWDGGVGDNWRDAKGD